VMPENKTRLSEPENRLCKGAQADYNYAGMIGGRDDRSSVGESVMRRARRFEVMIVL